MSSDRKYIKLKYRIAWYIGTVLSFLLYFLGIIPLYIHFRRRYLKHPIAVVLMYHRVGDDSDESDITVSIKNFECQMAYLAENFKIVSIDEIMDLYARKSQLKADTVTITFDDGYKDNYLNAYPVLKKYNIPATIFITTGYVGQSDRLSKNEIVEMRNDIIGFGAHTVTHRVLAKLDRQSAVGEITDSMSDLEKILQEKIKYFAYPYGLRGRDFTDESMQIVKEAGFAAAFSTNNGYINSSCDIYALKRIGMRDFPLFVFKARLSGIFENKCLYKLRSIFKL